MEPKGLAARALLLVSAVAFILLLAPLGAGTKPTESAVIRVTVVATASETPTPTPTITSTPTITFTPTATRTPGGPTDTPVPTLRHRSTPTDTPAATVAPTQRPPQAPTEAAAPVLTAEPAATPSGGAGGVQSFPPAGFGGETSGPAAASWLHLATAALALLGCAMTLAGLRLRRPKTPASLRD